MYYFKGQVFAGGSYLFGNKLLTSDGNVVDLGKIRSCRVYANGWYLLQKAQGAFLYDGKGKTVFQKACVSAVKVFANGWYFIKSDKDGILFRGKNKSLDFSVCDAEVYANGWCKLRDGKSWKLWNAKGDSVSSGLLDACVLNNGWYMFFLHDGALQAYTKDGKPIEDGLFRAKRVLIRSIAPLCCIGTAGIRIIACTALTCIALTVHSWQRK